MNKDQKPKERDEVQKYKLNLWGKDVLSIIDKYNPEGFDTWTQLIAIVNKEYHSIFYYDNNALCNHGIHLHLFNCRGRYNDGHFYPMIIYNYFLQKLTLTDYKIPFNY